LVFEREEKSETLMRAMNNETVEVRKPKRNNSKLHMFQDVFLNGGSITQENTELLETEVVAQRK